MFGKTISQFYNNFTVFVNKSWNRVSWAALDFIIPLLLNRDFKNYVKTEDS